MKVIATNRKAYHQYQIMQKMEAGIELKGTEVKAIRLGNVNFADSYAAVDGGELYLVGMNVQPYEQGNIFNHPPTRRRRLLMHKGEIRKLKFETEGKGWLLVPLSVYLNDKRRIKVEVGLARVKRTYDKREDLAKAEARRAIRAAMRSRKP